MSNVLVTGATGYIGGRLVPKLLALGHRVRVLARDSNKLGARAWSERVEVATGDVLNPNTLPPAMDGIEIGYYLVHSMGGGKDFHRRDVEAALNFAAAAADGGVKRIIYWGGLGDAESDLSEHLSSRRETGDALRTKAVPVTEFRSAVILGSGSISFEIIRHLVERLPVMICPRWVSTKIQPISIADLLNYLVAALDQPDSAGRIIEIGGSDTTTHQGLMLSYARIRGLRRKLVSVPVLTPRLSSYWVHWVTPIPAAISSPLIEGLRNEVVVRDWSARQLFPEISPGSCDDALNRIVEDLDAGRIETAWSDTALGRDGPGVLTSTEGMIVERRVVRVSAPARIVYRVVSGIGGDRGWFFGDWAWRVRGLIDRALGGVGLRRGRRHPDDLRVGDALDFWRVEVADTANLLRLRAEMKLPGSAWLQYTFREDSEGVTTVEQTATFAPKGLAGLVYWYALYPIHALIFRGLLRRVAKRALKAVVPIS
jgi:uncharacterized protein YbjT (DUF2867 family)